MFDFKSNDKLIWSSDENVFSLLIVEELRFYENLFQYNNAMEVNKIYRWENTGIQVLTFTKNVSD